MPDIPHAPIKTPPQGAGGSAPQKIEAATTVAQPPSIAAAPPATTEEAATKVVEAAITGAGITSEDLERYLEKIVHKHKRAAVEAAKPKPPNWATITEADLSNPDVFIPVIEHEIPDYMNMKLKDPEYLPVWASKDQRRLGQLRAEGYEFLKPEHVHPEFKLPLLFDGEKMYRYVDVVCMRVHKSIVFGKRKKALLLSTNQLKNTKRPPKVKSQINDLGYDVDVMADQDLNFMFKSGKAEFYDPVV